MTMTGRLCPGNAGISRPVWASQTYVNFPIDILSHRRPSAEKGDGVAVPCVRSRERQQFRRQTLRPRPWLSHPIRR